MKKIYLFQIILPLLVFLFNSCSTELELGGEGGSAKKNNSTKLIKMVKWTEIYDGIEDVLESFEYIYDDKQRIKSIKGVNSFLLSSFTYENNRITMRCDGFESGYILDNTDYVTRVDIKNGDLEYYILCNYSNGNISKATVHNYPTNRSYTNNYTWENGNLTKISNGSGKTNSSYIYGNKENRMNVDPFAYTTLFVFIDSYFMLTTGVFLPLKGTMSKNLPESGIINGESVTISYKNESNGYPTEISINYTEDSYIQKIAISYY